MGIWCMIETALGVLSVAEVCRGAVQRRRGEPNAVVALCMGFGDLGTELHAPQVPGRHNFVTSAQLCLLAARAYGLVCRDNITSP